MKLYVKLICLFINFIFSGYLLFPQNNLKTSDIFNLYESSIVYIEQVLYFKSSDFNNKNVFKQIEEKYDMKFIDEYINLSSGSGFFISNEGHIITNNHVVDKTDLKNNRKKLLNYLIFELSEKMPQKEFESKYYQINQDLTNLIDKSELFYRIKVDNKTNYIAEILISNKKLDLALLKINGSNFNFVPFGDNNSLKVGDTVIAIGYPMPTKLKFLKEFKATLSIGNISSIRDELEGIQHTAPINPGNSGGPLLDMNGTVIGINVSKIFEAEGIQFAIPVNKLINWLKDEKHTNILDINSKAKKNEVKNSDKENNKILETGNTIFINYNEQADVFINNVLAGKTPLLIKTLKEGKSIIRIITKNGYDIITVNVNPNSKDIYTFNPVIRPFSGKLYVESIPVRSYLYLNNELYGQTPLLLQDLKVGKYELELRTDEYKKITDNIEIKKEELLEKKYNLEKTYLIRFKNELPENTIIELVKDDQKIVYEILKQQRLEIGKYEMFIKNDYLDLKNMPLIINIVNEDIYIDYNVVYKEADLIFNNLKKSTIILIDSIDISKSINNNVVKIKYGKHSIVIKYLDNQILYKDIEILNDKFEIKLVYKFNSISF